MATRISARSAAVPARSFWQTLHRERTRGPSRRIPSYDEVFGPQVLNPSAVQLRGGRVNFESVKVDSFDVTHWIPDTHGGFHPTLPTFDISRENGVLDGWTAFLRDSKTKRALSNVRPLSGPITQGVQLVTNHGKADALEGAELVVAPPIGAAVPTGVLCTSCASVMDFPAAEKYPALPDPQTITGSVTGPNGPTAADIVFEALAFTDVSGQYDYLDFEYTGYASARPGQNPNAPSTYSVTLPQGPYRVDVRPLDGSTAMEVTRLDVGARTTTKNFVLGAPRTLRGTARLTDNRPLVAATVEAIPQSQGCSTPPNLGDGGGALGPLKTLDLSSPGCLPRPQQATTQPNGSFELPLDPGGYVVRIRPSDGTRLPWVTQDLPAGTGDQTLDIEVPAPFHTGFQLVDADGALVTHAVVRAFAGSVEIGQTISATDGRCDLYLALPP